MTKNKDNRHGIILTRFPLESGWGGEEKLHLALFDSLAKSGCPTFVWSSDRQLVENFQKHHHTGKYRAWYRDITTLWSLMLFPILGIMLLIEGFFVLRQKRTAGFDAILMLTLLEKIVLTPLAHALGYRIIWAHHAPLGDWLYRHPLLPFWRWWSKYVTIVTPSEAMRLALKQARPQTQIRVVPNPVMLAPTSVDAGADFRRQYGIPEEKIVVATAGRLAKEKNPGRFVHLAERFPTVAFVMAGEGAMRQEIERSISSKQVKNLILLGQLTEIELAALYRATDIFCILSDYETFCLAAAEAIASGVPVVAARAGGIPEVVTDGKTGILFPPQDFEAAADALQKLITDPQLRMRFGQAAQAASTRFSFDGYERMMREILFGESGKSDSRHIYMGMDGRENNPTDIV